MSDAIDLRELATIHNADNRDAFLSVYLDRSDPNHDTLVRTRIRQIRRATEDDEIAKRLEAGLERILSASANLEGSVRAIAGFVDLLGDFVLCGWVRERLPDPCHLGCESLHPTPCSASRCV